jgi:hypothetical protein
VTRSTTTPLVATSEFNVAIGTANGTATWATRAFDAGMKGQNCEARFSYRGFAATSKVNIKQNSNIVASLTLTPATDPRIASINFPCGDLSNPTTFVVTDTAILAGTNEIGGIYVGLATNMANVAQAELAGATEYSSCGAVFSVTSTSFASQSTVASCILNNFGSATTSTKDLSITIPNAKPGFYQITANILPYSATVSNSCYWSIKEDTSGYLSGSTYASPSAGFGAVPLAASQLSASYNNTTTSTRTWRVVAKSSSGACAIDPQVAPPIISVYRFPSSSELVVTPERQNTFGGVVWAGNTDLSITATTTSAIINTTGFGTPTPFGKATVASTSCSLTANDIGVCLENVPAGTYEVTTSFVQGAFYSFGTPGNTACSARIHVAGTSFSETSVASASVEVNVAGGVDWSTLSSGVVIIPSFQSKLSLVLKQSKNTANGRCIYRSSANGTTFPARPTITFKPLDQPSNSALYVQGPVLGAQTGAAIPASYVGEKVTWATAPSTSFTVTTSMTDWTNAFVTLNPGVWLLQASINANIRTDAYAGYDVACTVRITDSAGNLIDNQQKNLNVRAGGNQEQRMGVAIPFMAIVNVTAPGTIYKFRAQRFDNIGSGACSLINSAASDSGYSHFFATRLN